MQTKTYMSAPPGAGGGWEGGGGARATAARERHFFCGAELLHGLDRVKRLHRGLDADCREPASEVSQRYGRIEERPRERARGRLCQDRPTTF